MCLQYKWFSSDAFYLLGDRTMSRPKVRAPSVFGLFACLLVVLAFITSIHADPANLTQLTDSQKALLSEHVLGGLPSPANIYIGQGYIPSQKPPA